MSHSRDFGKKIAYDPTWTGPLNIKRKAENIPFTVAYYLFVGLWIGVAIYAYLAGDVSKFEENDDFTTECEQFVASEWWIVLTVFLLGAFWSILFLALLRVAAKFMVYTAIALMFTIIGLAVFGSACALIFERTRGTFAGFIVCTLLLIISIWAYMTKSKFIPMTCEIIREAVKAIFFFPLVFIYTMAYYALATIFTYFIMEIWVHLASIVIIEGYVPIQLYFCDIINVIALIWINCHMWGIYRLSVAGSYGTWYWAMNKREVPLTTTLRFIYIAVRYHIGPVAFGSLILTVCFILRMLISMICSSAGADDPNANPVTCLFRSCLLCCYAAVSCLETIVESVTGLSFVYIALHGGGFIDAARESFNMFRRNFLKVAILSQIVRILCVVAMVLISILTVLVFWGLVSSQSIALEERQIVLGLCILGILVLVGLMLEPLSIAVDTIFTCVLEDFEMNGGTNRPYHMSDKLKKLVLENRLE
ncbi:choline transporter-like protein 1 [Trichogramma pretiosum]|uniref:choline transporter-like protein 1 n=1 Tax=Trichogramma pretiosum TaxID=7493 RepID=UPI0006C9E534|nr:choline transporter-like protein 1 [Trichogramma pretiosum]